MAKKRVITGSRMDQRGCGTRDQWVSTLHISPTREAQSAIPEDVTSHPMAEPVITSDNAGTLGIIGGWDVWTSARSVAHRWQNGADGWHGWYSTPQWDVSGGQEQYILPSSLG